MIGLSTDGLPYRAIKQLASLQLLQRQATRRDDEVPLVFRERCLLSGYRIPNKSWSYYAASFFQLHNESGNIWSHFVASVIFIYKADELLRTYDVMAEPLTWPVLAFSLAIVLYAVFSTLAHLFQSKSPLVHYACFQIDYIGIGLNAFGTSCLFYYLTGSRKYYGAVRPTVFMTVNALLAVADCVTCSLAKLRYSRPYPARRRLWQLGAVGVHVLFGSAPLFYHFRRCLAADDPDDPDCGPADLLPHLHTFVWFAVSVYFFSSAMPERLAPGRFDLLGHGHQLFHVLMIITSLLQLRTAAADLARRPRDLVALATPDAVVIFGAMAVVLLADVVFIVLTHNVRVRKVASDAVLEQQYAKTAISKQQ